MKVSGKLQTVLGAVLMAGLMTTTAINPAMADDAAFAKATQGLEAKTGFINLYQDRKTNKVYMELPKQDDNDVSMKVLYAKYLRAGLGSNPIGLDRSQPGGTNVMIIRRVGDKVIFEAENLNFRASADNLLEKESVKNSFARSYVWGGKVTAEADDGRFLVDVTSFLTRDSHGVAARLKRARAGTARLDQKRSYADLKETLVFPKNIELDSVLTFDVSGPSSEIRGIAADSNNITLMTHHSFIALPEDGFKTRVAKPWTAAFGRGYQDYSAPLGESIVRGQANRHRLEKIDPTAAVSEVVKPIVYYVDSGAPKNIRDALVEGGNWWATAFEAAGFKNAYRVEVLPEGAHPLDIRYNMINWVHRQTRGWSYGGSISDPRTGEIIKGNVLLGSLRVRQDIKIFEGLAGVKNSGTGNDQDPIKASLARIRQLSAHEIGHTLGFAHNMGASTLDRSSVMDYPAPDITLDANGEVDLSNAYGVGMGAWDDYTVKYLYAEVPEGMEETEFLDKILEDGFKAGLRFVDDRHSRAFGTGHPYGALWDTRNDPIESLGVAMDVRAKALSEFGLGNIHEGDAVSDLANVIVPVYLYHRFQIQAAAKSLGGMYFTYGTKGDGQPLNRLVDPKRQQDALDALLATIDPAALDLSDDVLMALTPALRTPTMVSRELFRGKTNPAFDVLSAANVAAALTFNELLHPSRAGRLVEFNRRDTSMPSFESVLEQITANVFPRKMEGGRLAEIRRVVQSRYINDLINLAGNGSTMARSGASAGGGNMGPASSGVTLPGVQMRAEDHLRNLATDLGRSRSKDPVTRSHERSLNALIKRFLSRTAGNVSSMTRSPSAPPGSPIGSDPFMGSGMDNMCWHCDTVELLKKGGN
jgi:hypothetical protein